MRNALTVATLAGLSFLAACEPLDPPTPPLLESVTADGDPWSICPDDVGYQRNFPKYGHGGATILNNRLEEQFPPGTPETVLIEALTAQAFEMDEPPCANVRRAVFVQTAKYFGLSESMVAQVAWEADEAGDIVWTASNVGFSIY